MPPSVNSTFNTYCYYATKLLSTVKCPLISYSPVVAGIKKLSPSLTSTSKSPATNVPSPSTHV